MSKPLQLRRLSLLDILWPWSRIRELYHHIACLEHNLHLERVRYQKLSKRVEEICRELEKP